MFIGVNGGEILDKMNAVPTLDFFCSTKCSNLITQNCSTKRPFTFALHSRPVHSKDENTCQDLKTSLRTHLREGVWVCLASV